MSRMIAALAGLALMAGATSAAAQQSVAGNPLVERVIACKKLPDEHSRVLCYDQAVDALSQATSTGSVVVIDKAEVRQTRRSLFGFSLPKMPLFRGDTTQEEEPDEIEGKIASVRGLGHDKYLIVLDSGARWQTTEANAFGATPAPGDAITIKKGTLGAYFIKIGKGRAVKGLRVG